MFLLQNQHELLPPGRSMWGSTHAPEELERCSQSWWVYQSAHWKVSPLCQGQTFWPRPLCECPRPSERLWLPVCPDPSEPCEPWPRCDKDWQFHVRPVGGALLPVRGVQTLLALTSIFNKMKFGGKTYYLFFSDSSSRKFAQYFISNVTSAVTFAANLTLYI